MMSKIRSKIKLENGIRAPYTTAIAVGIGFGVSMLAILAMIGTSLLAQEADAAIRKVKESEPTKSDADQSAPDVLSIKPVEGWKRGKVVVT